jgi:hypothetical protein
LIKRALKKDIKPWRGDIFEVLPIIISTKKKSKKKLFSISLFKARRAGILVKRELKKEIKPFKGDILKLKSQC